MKLKLNSEQLDILKEIGSICAGNAATALSKLLRKKVEVRVPSTEVVEFNNVSNMLGGPGLVMASVFLQVFDEKHTGSFFLIFPYNAALDLADLLVGTKSSDSLDIYGESALKEVGNITASTYVSALAEVVSKKYLHSVPALVIDMLQATLDGVLSALALETDKVVLNRAEFIVDNTVIDGTFLFLLDAKSLDEILKDLRS
jgi:chemotaxis protein CheC